MKKLILWEIVTVIMTAVALLVLTPNLTLTSTFLLTTTMTVAGVMFVTLTVVGVTKQQGVLFTLIYIIVFLAIVMGLAEYVSAMLLMNSVHATSVSPSAVAVEQLSWALLLFVMVAGIESVFARCMTYAACDIARDENVKLPAVKVFFSFIIMINVMAATIALILARALIGTANLL